MDRLIINCDLGENESAARTSELLALVGAANIGCGVHAGSSAKTRATIGAAHESGVRIGAHPGLGSEAGRGRTLPTPAAFARLLREQFGSFQDAAAQIGAKVDYIKLHGSLYHAVELDSALAKTYLEFLNGDGQGLGVFSLAGGSFVDRCRAVDVRVYEEAFADRAYLQNGSLVPRGEAGAVLGAVAAMQRFRAWRTTGEMPVEGGRSIPLVADTLCVHGDGPDAIPLLQAIRQAGLGQA
jgi:UPF0271 protein